MESTKKKVSFKELMSKDGKVIKTISSNINLIVLIILFFGFYIYNPNFLGTFNLKNLILSLAPLLVMACGASYVKFAGSLDLSMGAVCSCANVILVSLFPYTGAWSYIIAILFGLLTGIILGFIVVKLKVPSFIASLGMMNVYQSVALLITHSPFSVAKEYRPLIDWGKTYVFGVVSILTVVAFAIMLILVLVHRFTPIGRSLNMIGANERTARISGVEVDKAKMMAFAICGVTSALVGILLAVKLKSCDPAVGNSYTLLAVAASLLGGISSSGGKGHMGMTLIGVAMVVMIQNGMTIIGVDAWWTQIIFGALIIVAMIFTSEKSSKGTVVK